MGWVIASLVGALALASPAQAIGLTFKWSFDGTNNLGTGTQLGLVSGTISGLQDNTTNTSGLTATVLTTPDHQYEGLTFNNLEPSHFITVASGVVTSFNLVFIGSSRDPGDNLVFLGTILGSNNQYGINSSPPYLLGSNDNSRTFSPTPVPFDFDPSFGLVALGGIWAGRKVIKKIKTSKKSV